MPMLIPSTNERLLRRQQGQVTQQQLTKYAPNGMWTYFVSVFYMANRDANGILDDQAFYEFLNKIIGFIWAYAITNPGVNALRTPVYAEMLNVVAHKPVGFQEFLFDRDHLERAIRNYGFSNNRSITKSMLTWWAFRHDGQELPPLDSIFEIEHIYARNRQEKEHSLKDAKNIESLGNKSLLEKRINIIYRNIHSRCISLVLETPMPWLLSVIIK